MPPLWRILSIQWYNLCSKWPEHKIKLIDNCSSTFNKASLLCKHIQTLYSNWLLHPIRGISIIFASIPIYDRSDREGFFPWLECLEAACFYSGRNIKTEALGRFTGPVQNVIMALPNARSWRATREELKRCFSDQISLGHAAAQLENMTQKPNESLRLYISRYSKLHKSVTKRDAFYNIYPSMWFRFLTSITNTTIADKIIQSEFLPQNLQQCFEKALRLKANLQLSEGINMA